MCFIVGVNKKAQLPDITVRNIIDYSYCIIIDIKIFLTQ